MDNFDALKDQHRAAALKVLLSVLQEFELAYNLSPKLESTENDQLLSLFLKIVKT